MLNLNSFFYVFDKFGNFDVNKVLYLLAYMT